MDKPISYHTFMFPFRWDIIDNKNYKKTKNHSIEDYFNKTILSERISIKEFDNLIKKCGWSYKPFKIKDYLEYNEYFYFHSFVRNALYNKEEVEKNNNRTSYYYEKDFDGYNFKLKINSEDDSKNNSEDESKDGYILNIDGISLRAFDTGIAILSINLENNQYYNFDDILKINDYGRKIYPQCFDNKKNTICLAKSIEIYKDKEPFSNEEFNSKEIPEEIEIAKYIMDILNKKLPSNSNNKDSESIFTTNKEKLSSNSNNNSIFIEPLVDDRMFVMSFYVSKYISNKNESDIKNFIQTNDYWYKYVFIDGDGKTCQSKELSQKLINEATYDRWINYGTIYGLTRYSFVVLVQPSYPDYLINHFKTMYFQMVNLLLAQRASVLRFSHEVSHISDLEENKIDDKEVTSLYLHYIRFVNKLWFREVSAQEQGIEIYNLGVKQMKLESQIKDLDNELNELNEFVTLKLEKKRNEEAQRLTEIATIFIPPTLVAGILGMNVYGENLEDGNIVAISLILLFIPFLVPFINIFLYKFYTVSKTINKQSGIILKVLSLLYVLVSLLFVYNIDFFKSEYKTNISEKSSSEINTTKKSKTINSFKENNTKIIKKEGK
jgi:hypothetical protein